jgi:carbon dioxide concentrating mechanism protein CcmN
LILNAQFPIFNSAFSILHSQFCILNSTFTMSLPFHLDPITTTQYMTSGDVVIGEGTTIAPGVLLQADPCCRIVLGAGVCLGMGCVIHASGGEIRIGRGANLAAGVLVVGYATIGPGALVGAGTTVFGQVIGPGAMIAPGSLLVNEAVLAANVPAENGAAPSYCPTEPTPTAPRSAATPPADRAEVGANGYFYAKGNGKVAPQIELDDPWNEPSPVSSPAPNVPSASAPTFVPDRVMPEVEPIPGTAIPTTTPVVSTYVYPDDILKPKHAWETSAHADLGSSSNPAASCPITPPSAFQNNSFQQNSGQVPPPGTDRPESDLSAAEMQYAADNHKSVPQKPPNPPPQSSDLAPRDPKQVYGQAYVNQMLGKMLGKS